ncbi:DUF3515 family protein [Microbacterium lacusdiani]
MIRRFAAAAALVLTLGLSGCAATVHLEAAQDANDPLCADVTVRLPDAIQHLERRWTDAQSTGAWADEEGTAVILSCGVTPPGPTTLQCVTFDGVDWIVDPEALPMQRITSYGRTPATQVYVDTSRISPDQVLAAVSRLVSSIPAESRCVDPDEATKVDE